MSQLYSTFDEIFTDAFSPCSRNSWGAGKVSIKKGIKQGCFLSLSLFNLYSEEAINEIKEETENIGVEVLEKTIKMLRSVGDIALLANT